MTDTTDEKIAEGFEGNGNMVKVHFTFNDPTMPFYDPENFGGESPWAEETDQPGIVVLRNQPVLIDLSWGDKVRVVEKEHSDEKDTWTTLEVVEIVERYPHGGGDA